MEDLSQLGERYGAFGTQSPQEPPPLSKLGDMVVGAYQGLEGLAKRAFEASRGDLQHLGDHSYEPQSIGPGLEGALMAMTGGVAGTGQGGIALGSGPIRAYHGSPHDFDRFDLSKIGTGEGAQAYGHGLYFAEHEPVAQQYRDQLKWKGGNFDDPQVLAQNALDRLGDRAAAADNLQSSLDSVNSFHRGKPPPSQAEANTKTEQAIALLRGNDPITGKPPTPGRMYEVDINADPAHFLDWDKPIAAQSGYVNDKLKRVFDQSLEGREAYQSLIRDRPGAGGFTSAGIRLGATPEAASGRFNATGIPGIKYLDQGSRGAGQGSSNYVVFNDRIIDIMRKYGLAGIPAAGAVLAGQDRE